MQSTVDETETAALVALLMQPRVKWADVRIALDDYAASELLGARTQPSLLDDPLTEAVEQVRQWRAGGLRVSSIYSPDYPGWLRAVHDFPPVLFSRGEFSDADQESVAIVGTRKPSRQALAFIDELVPLIADGGRTIVSGLAMGVDAAAMHASLRSGNRTVAVIGTGIRRSYPTENAELQEQIAREHLLLSQFWPDAPPTRISFPMRNHVMSAFSGMTLIVEAGENSGTRIQARAATQHGRPLVITRAVFAQTNWAKELVSRGLDVTVVGNASEAASAVQTIADRRRVPVVSADQILVPAGA